MDERRESRVVVTSQLNDALRKLRSQIAIGFITRFERAFTDEHGREDSYEGKVSAELVGAYLRKGAVVAIALIELECSEAVIDKLCRLLCEKLHEELYKTVPYWLLGSSGKRG